MHRIERIGYAFDPIIVPGDDDGTTRGGDDQRRFDGHHGKTSTAAGSDGIKPTEPAVPEKKGEEPFRGKIR